MALEEQFTVKEISENLKISPQMVYSLIRQEEIPAFKIGTSVRVSRQDFENFVDRRKRLFSAENQDEPKALDSVFSVRHLFARNGGFFLTDLSFEIPVGSTLGVIGGSGQGKTLFLHCLAGVHPTMSGRISLKGKRIEELSSNSRNTGLVFQDFALYPNRTSRGNIAFPQEMKNETSEEIDKRVTTIARELGIDDAYLKRGMSQLPMGIKQLVAIGRAENRNIDLMVMDEPLKHLDPALRHETRVFLKSLVAHLGLTTVYALNDVADAIALCEYLFVIKEGRFVQFGKTQDVYANPSGPEAMELLSENGMSAIALTIRAGKDEAFKLSFDVPDGDYLFCFRPENADESGKDFRAKIKSATFYDGNRSIARCALSNGSEVKLLLSSGHEEDVSFSVPEGKLYPRA